MKQIVAYQFLMEAVSPLYFGEAGDSVVKNSKNQPVVLGNSMGGALRQALEETAVPRDIILAYMGGAIEDQEENKEFFIPSGIYISDGELSSKTELVVKEGTAIFGRYGTAEDKKKYGFEHLPEGVKLSFRIEAEVIGPSQQVPGCKEEADHKGDKKNELNKTEFDKLIGTWAHGIEAKTLLFGGEKSNGFGRFRLLKLERKVFPLGNSRQLDQYLFGEGFAKEAQDWEAVDWRRLDAYPPAGKKRWLFSLTGEFPYGVYQNFKISGKDPVVGKKNITGVQSENEAYYIPASSVKGLLRSEIRLLLEKMRANAVDQKIEQLFGGREQQGKLLFSDLKLDASRKVRVKRYKRMENGKNGGDKASQWELREENPVYIKIDRLTGGAYQSALKEQQEIQGKATLRCQLVLNQVLNQSEESPFVFPLVYVLRRIGAGMVPLGGRTVMGLGEFYADEVTVKEDGKDHAIAIGTVGVSRNETEWLRRHYDAFQRWCEQGC